MEPTALFAPLELIQHGEPLLAQLVLHQATILTLLQEPLRLQVQRRAALVRPVFIAHLRRLRRLRRSVIRVIWEVIRQGQLPRHARLVSQDCTQPTLAPLAARVAPH